MDEYASSRFISVWVTASTEPTSMVSTATTPSTSLKSQLAAGKATYTMRSSAPNAAIFVQAAMNAVIGVGAPWYTSGVQTWNGTAATLNSRPMASNAKPPASSAELLAEPSTAAWIAANSMLPAYP